MTDSPSTGPGGPEQARTEAAQSAPAGGVARPWTRLLNLLRPSHAHSAFSATVILMAFQLLSRIIGLVRGLPGKLERGAAEGDALPLEN